MSQQQIAKTRAALASKHAERAAMGDAPPARAEVRAALAAHLRRDVDDRERTAAYRIASAQHDGLFCVRAAANGQIDLLPVLAMLFGVDTLATALDRFVEIAPDGPTVAERARGMAAIDAEIAALETAEERACRALEATGVDVVRRADASPAIVLAGLS